MVLVGAVGEDEDLLCPLLSERLVALVEKSERAYCRLVVQHC